MAWVRIHDGALTHPKIVGLPDKAFRLWVWGLCYCQMHLTDGVIPVQALIGPTRTAAVLVLARLWEALETGGWRVHDYLEWNDSRALVLRKRSEAKERMTNARQRSSREHTPENFSGSSTLGRIGLALEGKGCGENPDGFERFWAAYPKHSGRQACQKLWLALCPSPELQERIQRGVEAYVRHVGDWKPQFIKAPLHWLEGAHWDDELDAGPAVPKPACQHQPACADAWAHDRLVRAEASGDPELVASVKALHAKQATA